jgi:hypothetical protein
MTRTTTLLTSRPRVLTGPNPFGVDPALDLLRPTRNVPHYSETMYFAVVDREDPSLGLFLHTGRMAEDTDLWWARTVAYLPGGEVVVDRSHGRAPDDRGPATGDLAIRCTEPGHRWRLRFDGAGERTSREATARGLVGAGPVTPLRFDVECEAVGPVWDLQGAVGATEDLDPAVSVWAAGHHEQGFLARGELTVGDRTWTLDGVAYRDHSWGPREMSDFGADAYVALVFPESRRVVQGVTVFNAALEPVLRCFHIWEDGRLELMGEGAVPRANDAAGHPDTGLELVMQRVDGERLVLPGEVTAGVTISIVDPNRNLNGAAHGLPGALFLNEELVRYTWPDGEVGLGHAERAIRPADVRA